MKIIHLHRCQGVTRRIIRNLLQHDPSLKNLYYLTSSQFSKLLKVPMKRATLLYYDLHNSSLYRQLIQDSRQYTIISIVDEDYPSMLKTIKDAPIVLYALGNASLLKQHPSLSVIGTRNPTKDAKAKIDLIIKPLIQNNWIIISGMAKGIDSFAHNIALENMGKTVAVLGGGFHHMYPKQNFGLFKQIAREGLVLSEYPPNVSPKPYHFPERNRIISGLSFGTLVIEAMEKSGTLITVDQALDQGKEVYAVPGSPMIPQTKGCNRMIQDGAKLVISYQDLIEDWQALGENWLVINE